MEMSVKRLLLEPIVDIDGLSLHARSSRGSAIGASMVSRELSRLGREVDAIRIDAVARRLMGRQVMGAFMHIIPTFVAAATCLASLIQVAHAEGLASDPGAVPQELPAASADAKLDRQLSRPAPSSALYWDGLDPKIFARQERRCATKVLRFPAERIESGQPGAETAPRIAGHGSSLVVK